MCCARSCANPTERQLVRWRKASVCLVSHLGETSSASSCIFGRLRASSGVFARLSAIKGRGLRKRSRNRERVLDCLFQLAHKIKQIHKLRFLPLYTTSAYGKRCLRKLGLSIRLIKGALHSNLPHPRCILLYMAFFK